MKKNIESRNIGDWTVMQQTPPGKAPFPVLLLLHGWTGDENVMWVFTRRLSERYLILAPRGIFSTSSSGYGWQPRLQREWPKTSDFQASINELIQLLSQDNFPQADFSNLSAIGFSQGAALMFTFALLYPMRMKVMAGLAGFLPEDADDFVKENSLSKMRIFIAHGRLDDRVPVEKARDAVEILTRAGAQVNYCEEDVGHKLSASCFRSMEYFFNMIDESAKQ